MPLLREEPHEDVQPARRALGIRPSPHVVGKLEDLLDLGEVHAAAVEHERLVAIEPPGTGREAPELSLDATRARKEARLELPDPRTEPQIDARRLDLSRLERRQRLNGTLLGELPDGLAHEDAAHGPDVACRSVPGAG
jgi:hypothetical protein